MARLVFFRYTPEGYVGDDDGGLLVGTGWSDTFGNGFRAIIFLMDFSELKYQRSIQFIYDVEVLPEGQPKYIHSDTKTLVLSNDVLVEYDPALPLSRFFGKQAPRTEPAPLTAIGQLDLFIGLYFKGTIAPPATGLPPIYEWLTDLIIQQEVPETLLTQTRLAIAALIAIGIILTLEQMLALNEYYHNLPDPAPAARAKAEDADVLSEDVITFLRSIGVEI